MAEGCKRCEEMAARQAEQMQPREPKKGYALVAKREAFLPVFGQRLPDVRLGDIVSISLIAGAVEDAGYCEECEA